MLDNDKQKRENREQDKREQALHKELTEKIIGCFFAVYNNLGYGFLEKVYENAMKLELENAGLAFESQKEIRVFYNGVQVGYYVSDIIVDDKVLLELKAVSELAPEHICQLVNYLRGTSIEVGLLLNFGRKPSFRRRSFLNCRKSLPSSFSS